MKKLFLGLALSGVVISASVWAAGSDELWEIKTRMNLGMKVQAVTNKVCLPKGGVYMPEKSPQDNNCEMTDVKVTGNKTNWKMHCTGENATETVGEVTRTADVIKGTIQMTMKDGKLNQIISGKRVGTCQAK